MARYLGPKCKLSRREGVDLLLKSGIRPLKAKCKITSHPGQKRGFGRRASEYGIQLREKQKVKRLYGLLERQFRITYKKASRSSGVTGVRLLQLLEVRLDNLVYRMGFAATRAEARQLVSHKAVMLNGKICNIPSAEVKVGDKISMEPKAASQNRVAFALQISEQKEKAGWLEIDQSGRSGVLLALPEREQLSEEINENQIVELYSK